MFLFSFYPILTVQPCCQAEAVQSRFFRLNTKSKFWAVSGSDCRNTYCRRKTTNISAIHRSPGVLERVFECWNAILGNTKTVSPRNET